MDSVEPGGGLERADADRARIARAARVYFGADIGAVLLTVAASAARARWLGGAASVVIGLAMIPLVRAIVGVLPKDAPTIRIVTSIGLLAAVAGIVNGIAIVVGTPTSAAAVIATVLNGGWLILVGSSRPTLPPPLPRRAVVGGIGSVVFAASFLVASQSPLYLAIIAVGVLLGIQVLGFLFGLMDLDRPRPIAAP